MRRRTTVGVAGAALVLGATILAGASAASASRGPASAPHVAPPSLGALTTYGYNNLRSGDDTVDPAITSLSSAPIWNASLDGAVYGQPLIYYGQVFVGTENDTIYSLSAKTGKVLWSRHVGTAPSLLIVDSAPTLNDGCGDIDPLGITGTPVIDTAKNELFAAEETLVGGNKWQDIRHWLVAVSLITHKELWHRDLDPPHGNSASHYYVPAEQQRPGATLFDHRVYVEFGGLAGDCGQYHGYVVSLPETGNGRAYVYGVPTQREGGIWGTGGAFVSAKGNLYVATGNGSSNSISDFDEGNSVIELSPKLHRLGYFAPSNWVQLNDADWDLGSAGPIAVPDSTLLFAAGKPGASDTPGYLMEQTPLKGIGKGAFTAKACESGGVFGADASAVIGTGAAQKIYLYLPCGGGTEGIEVHVANPFSFKMAWSPSKGTPNGPPIVAGGYVWALNWSGNELYAMNPTTGHVATTRSTEPLNHFATPGVGDGILAIPTQNGVEAFRAS